MKKTKILLIMLSLILISGCSIKENKPNAVANTTINVTYKDSLEKVLNNQKKFYDENGNQSLINEYKLPSEELVVIQSYAYIDLNNDGEEELVVYTDSNYGAYLIFHFYNNKIYGYVIGIRSLENLKKDGSFMGSNGADSSVYSKMSFEKDKYTIKEEAVNDGTNNVYKINNKNVTVEEINEFVQNWNLKEDVTYIKK